jgi:hypothetical protein
MFRRVRVLAVDSITDRSLYNIKDLVSVAIVVSTTDRSLDICLFNVAIAVLVTDISFTQTGVTTSDTILVEVFDSVIYNDFNIESVAIDIPVADNATYIFLINDTPDDSITESVR